MVSPFVQIDEEEAGGSGVKKERYFWQYNVQAKGPKGQVIQFDPTEKNMLKYKVDEKNIWMNMFSFRSSPLTQRSTTRTS